MIDNPTSLYGREEFVEALKNRILNNYGTNHVLLCGRWGSGKSTIVNKMSKELNNHNMQDTRNVTSIVFDAWKYDYMNDPSMAIIQLLLENSLIPDEKLNEWNGKSVDVNKVKKIPINLFETIIENKTGFNKQDLKSQNNPIIKEYLENIIELDTINSFLNEALSQSKISVNDRLVIFVDELDRARPEFALRTIERLHHLRTTLPLFIVYSVDYEALVKIVDNYYGYGSLSKEYLDKMFDHKIDLPKIDGSYIKEYIDSKRYRNVHDDMSYFFGNNKEEVFCKWLAESGYTFRTINKIINQLKDSYLMSIYDLIKKSDYHRFGAERKSTWVYSEKQDGILKFVPIYHEYLFKIASFLIILQVTHDDYFINIKYKWNNSHSVKITEEVYKMVEDFSLILGHDVIGVKKYHLSEEPRVVEDGTENRRMRTKKFDDITKVYIYEMIDILFEDERFNKYFF